MSKAFRMDLAANGMFPSIPLEASVLQALPLSLFCSLSSSVVLTFGTRDSFIMGSPVHFMMFTGIPYHYAASQVAQLVKNLPAMQEPQETWVGSVVQEDLLRKEMATQSSILAWKIPWTEELGGYSPWCHRVRHDQCIHLHACAHTHTHRLLHTRFQ